MEKKGFLLVLVDICIVLIIAGLLLMGVYVKPGSAQAPTQATKPVVLKAVTFKPVNVETCLPFKLFVNRVNERSKGKLSINWLGGPEVIGVFDQAGAVRKGVVDIAFIFAASYKGIVPGSEALQLTRLMPLEERQRGTYDFLVDLHKKANLLYLGHGQPTKPDEFFYLFTNKKVEKPKDLMGQKMGTGTIAPNFLQALGIAPVVTRELYTGMERGVIDGFAQPIETILPQGLLEVTKFVIDHPFFAGDVANIMNLDTWNQLPKNLQDLVIEVQISVERDFPAEWAKLMDRDWRQLMKTKKMEVIKFSPPDAKWFIEMAYKAEWDFLIKTYPELAPKLKQVLSK
jgi:TRAP-type C4-dicarboxylate transport system substrate-binding protein